MFLHFSFQQHLNVGAGENRHAVHRAMRWYEATEKAKGYAMVSWLGTLPSSSAFSWL
jgi:hypothetical protein